MYTYGYNPSRPRTPEANQQKGHGVIVTGIESDHRTGSFERTERMLDFALENEGYFSLQHANGDTVYTRNGSFHLSVEADGTYIVNGEGLYVLNEAGARIMVPFGVDTIEVDVNGAMRFLNNYELVGENTLGIFTFRNLHGLSAEGDGNFAQTPAAGERLPANNVVIRLGILEGSNVNLAEEMTRMIRTQRAFQLASRALTTADDMEGIANNMKR